MLYIQSMPSIPTDAHAVPIIYQTLISVLYIYYLIWPSQHTLCLICRFYYDSGRVRLTDQETAAIDSSQEEGTCHAMQGHKRKHQS